MDSKSSANRAPTFSRKRGYTTFKREIEEGGQDVVNLDGDDPLPPVKKRKRTITVIDFTQDDDEDDYIKDEPIFSPASKPQHRHVTCMSCNTMKSKDSFPTERESKRSLIDLGGAICRRCWEANVSAEQAHAEKAKEQECSICYDTVASQDFPATPHAGARGHTVCISCWERHLHTELERKDWDKLSCPQDGCGQVVKYGEIAVLDERFEQAIEPILAVKATASYLKQDDTYFACPSATCKSGNFLDENDENDIFTCTACNFSFCLSCEVPMHVGQSCEDYQDSIHGNSLRRSQERKSEAVMEGKYRTCTCGSKLDKMSGCDHVVCLHCKRAFNWSSLPKPVKKKNVEKAAGPFPKQKANVGPAAASQDFGVRRHTLAAMLQQRGRDGGGVRAGRMSMMEQLAARKAGVGKR